MTVKKIRKKKNGILNSSNIISCNAAACNIGQRIKRVLKPKKRRVKKRKNNQSSFNDRHSSFEASDQRRNPRRDNDDRTERKEKYRHAHELRADVEWDLLTTQNKYPPEAALALAILRRAIQDYRRARTRDRQMNPPNYFHCNATYVGSFLWICEALDVDPEKIRKRLHLKGKQIPITRVRSWSF